MGVNARIGIVPYKGYSMDDAIVISQSFANKLASQHNYEHNIQKDDTNKMGRVHYTSLFPTKFTKEQLELLDDDGIVKSGTVLKKGDPIMLATKPKAVNSAEHLGKLGRMIGQLRNDAAEVWEHDYPGMVTDSFNGKKSAKVFISAEVPAKIGDKIIAGRNGQKDIISKIIPDEQMLRTVDGKPYEVLLNHLALPSRVNTATSMEIALGKLAQHLGKPIKVPSFNDPKKTRINDVIDQLSKAGLSDKEYAFDPKTNIKLERPIATGIGHVMKLHHVVESKKSARGNSSYNMDEQPLKGGSDGAQAKRLGGLEVTALISKGAYETLREGSTIRGAKCFDATTEVLTAEGWKTWDTVVNTDLLLTKDKYGDNTARYEKPQQLVTYEFDGDLCGYEGKHLDWLVTPDHNLWGTNCLVSRNKPYRKLKTFNAESIVGKEGSIEVAGHIYPGELEVGHMLHFSCPATSRKTKDISVNILDYCRFMGWWLSEGYACVGTTGEITIYQNAVINPTEFAEIQELGRRMGLGEGTLRKCSPSGVLGAISSTSTTPVGTVVGIRWRSKPLAEHLLKYGNKAWLKRVPDIIFQAPLEARLEFLRTYGLGDGCIRKNRSKTKESEHLCIGTTSPQMADDIQRIALLSGFTAWVGIDGKAGEHYRKYDYYRIIISVNKQEATFRKQPAKQFKGHYRKAYKGLVYCATMSTGLLFVRRNGKAMWSGNCEAYWRLLRQGYKPADPGTPFVWDKFKILLNGAGMNTKDLGKGILRLAPMTDRDLEANKPIELENGKLVDPNSLEAIAGGLFDPKLVANNRWGKITLPHSLPNPAFEISAIIM